MPALRKLPPRWDLEGDLETGEPDPVEDYPAEVRAVSGSFWMFGILMLFFFAPVVNGLVAGAIGGYRIGTARNAVMAALGPLSLGTCFLWMFWTEMPRPFAPYPLTQLEIIALLALADLALLLGAAIGGNFAQQRLRRPGRI
jgi:hypothetical protein